MATMTPEEWERFCAKVEPADDGCLIWTGAKSREGYGTFWAGGRSRVVHRLAWEHAGNDLPDDLTIDHLCFQPSCVNPEHMRLLTNEENARNQRSAHADRCANGHEYTPENTYIRPRRYREGRRDCRACIRERVRSYKARKQAAA